jgi:hypothetical protein
VTIWTATEARQLPALGAALPTVADALASASGDQAGLGVGRWRG